MISCAASARSNKQFPARNQPYTTTTPMGTKVSEPLQRGEIIAIQSASCLQISEPGSGGGHVAGPVRFRNSAKDPHPPVNPITHPRRWGANRQLKYGLPAKTCSNQPAPTPPCNTVVQRSYCNQNAVTHIATHAAFRSSSRLSPAQLSISGEDFEGHEACTRGRPTGQQATNRPPGTSPLTTRQPEYSTGTRQCSARYRCRTS